MKLVQSLVLLIVICCYSVEGCYSIVPPPDNGRIVIQKGGNVMFNFNAMDKYSNGVTLTNWTVLNLTYFDEDPKQASLTWSFTIDSSLPLVIKMDGGSYEIPLEYLDFFIAIDAEPPVPFECENLPFKVIDKRNFNDYTNGVGNTTHKITITYKLGEKVGESLKASGCPSGYYYIDLNLLLNVE